ncbi:unnamed protein product [Closterium sp. Yama58-4]|nr:unnamed protein product [Closterium sp. Yama58-4]
MAPSQLSSSVTSSQDPPRSIITTSTSSSSRANLCSRQHSIVFSVTYRGRTVSICVACALLDFLVKFLFFIPRFILVLASFGVPLLLLPVGSLIDLTSPPMLVAQAIALVWYTCYLPGLQTIQAKRESFNRKRRMLQAVEARRTRSSCSDAGDLRKSRTEMVTAKSCAATEAGHSSCGEDEVVTRRSMTQSFGENLLCLRKLACEKATFASQGVRNGLSSARSAVTRSGWQPMVSARVTVTTTVTTVTSSVAATAAATAGRAAMTTKALAITCIQIPAVGARFSVWMLASAWDLLVSRMRIQRHLIADSGSPSISDSAFAEGTADVCTREAGERTRKRGGKGKKGARLCKAGRGRGAKAEFESQVHNGCETNEEREENETTEQSGAADSQSDVAAQQTVEIPEVSEHLLQQQQEVDPESAGTRTTNLCRSPDDKPWLPWLPSPATLSPSLKAPGALTNKWSPTPLSPPTEVSGMPFMLPQGSSPSGSFSNSAVDSAVSGYDWLERDANVTLPPPAVPAHVAYAATSATGTSPSKLLLQSPTISNAGFPSSASHPFHFDNSAKLGRSVEQQQEQHHYAVASLLPGSPFEGNGEEPELSFHGSYSPLGSGFADSLVSENAMYTREAIEECME